MPVLIAPWGETADRARLHTCCLTPRRATRARAHVLAGILRRWGYALLRFNVQLSRSPRPFANTVAGVSWGGQPHYAPLTSFAQRNLSTQMHIAHQPHGFRLMAIGSFSAIATAAMLPDGSQCLIGASPSSWWAPTYDRNTTPAAR